MGDTVARQRRQLDWKNFAAEGLDVYVGSPGCHPDIMLREPNAKDFAGLLRQCLDDVQTRQSRVAPAGIQPDCGARSAVNPSPTGTGALR